MTVGKAMWKLNGMFGEKIDNNPKETNIASFILSQNTGSLVSSSSKFQTAIYLPGDAKDWIWDFLHTVSLLSHWAKAPIYFYAEGQPKIFG